jgi:hypothetical protein
VGGKQYARATGRFVKKPNMKDARPEIVAVAVIKSLCIPASVRVWAQTRDDAADQAHTANNRDPSRRSDPIRFGIHRCRRIER